MWCFNRVIRAFVRTTRPVEIIFSSCCLRQFWQPRTFDAETSDEKLITWPTRESTWPMLYGGCLGTLPMKMLTVNPLPLRANLFRSVR
jgi:hypothetical protein